MKKPIRIGLVGAGANTKLRHILGFQAIDGVSVDVVANRSESSSQAVADEFGISRVAKDWRQIIDDPNIDAICIGTWPYMHAEVTIAALQAGKHVLTEARMAATLEEAEMMLAVGNDHGNLVKQIVPSPFTLKVDAKVCHLVESGVIGSIKEVLVEHSHGALCDPNAPLSWRQDKKYSGINMLTMGIYHEVIYRWLRKDLDWLTAHGIMQTNERRHWETGHKEPVLLPDSLYIQGQFDDGISFQYRFSGIDHGRGANEIRLIGDKGMLRLNVGQEILSLGKDGKEEIVPIDAESSLGWNVEEDFIRSIREGTPVKLTSFADGVEYMRFTNAVWKSISH